MHKSRIWTLGAICLILATRCTAQSPQVTAIINTVVQATGINTSVAFPGFQAKGQITYNWGDSPMSGTAAVFSSGNDQFRMDSTLAAGSQSVIVDGQNAELLPMSGSAVRISPRNITITKNPLLPAVELAASLHDNNATVSYIDTVPYGSHMADRILVQSREYVDSDVTKVAKIYYVDQATAMIVEVDERLTTADGGVSKVMRQIKYSSFVRVSGMVLPSAIQEIVNGTNTWQLQISSYSIPSVVPQSTFKF